MNLYFNNSVTGNNDWSDTSNWWTGPSSTGSNIAPGGGDYLLFESDCSQNTPTTIVNSLGIEAGVTLTLANTNVIDEFDSLSIALYISVSGTLVISNSITYGAPISCVSAGTISFLSGTTIPNGAGSITVNNGTLTIAAPATVTISAGGLSSAAISNSGTLNIGINIGNSILNDGTINVFGGTIVEGLTNNGTFNLSVVSRFSGYVSNYGTFTMGNGGFAVLQSSFNNYGSIIIDANGGFGSTPNAVVYNTGSFVFGSVYTTTMVGNIFPQIPSSAAWGNILI